jgi:hypothetical protein
MTAEREQAKEPAEAGRCRSGAVMVIVGSTSAATPLEHGLVLG